MKKLFFVVCIVLAILSQSVIFLVIGFLILFFPRKNLSDLKDQVKTIKPESPSSTSVSTNKVNNLEFKKYRFRRGRW